MKKKSKNILFIIVFILLLIINSILLLTKVNSNHKIPDNYIAVFHGGVGERTYETYIYKIDNNRVDFGFEYINVTITTKYWGSTNSTSRITSKGTFNWSEEAFTIAKKNEAYSYVSLPNSNTTYTIEQFQKIF